jgi:hypothetical protein
MADLRISAEAEADLDDIWLYVATEGQNAQRADYLLDRFAVFFSFPGSRETRIWGACAMTCDLDTEASRWATTWWFIAWPEMTKC